MILLKDRKTNEMFKLNNRKLAERFIEEYHAPNLLLVVRSKVAKQTKCAFCNRWFKPKNNAHIFCSAKCHKDLRYFYVKEKLKLLRGLSADDFYKFAMSLEN